MRVAISQRHESNKYGDLVDSLENNYITFFREYDIDLYPISNKTVDINYFLDSFKVDGIILSGGGDVDANLYGERNENEANISAERDMVEYKMIDYALKLYKPILGICRGMQLMNVYFGGRLSPMKNHAIGMHNIIVSESFHRRFETDAMFHHNSYHNIGIAKNDLGEDLIPFAFSQNSDLIEGFFHPKFCMYGVQWHPEREKNVKPIDDFIIESFIKKRIFNI